MKHVDTDDLRYKRVKRDWEHGAGIGVGLKKEENVVSIGVEVHFT